MNQLTKHLVDGILNEDKQEIIALYAGGFKPPTAGHLMVVEKALEQYPEIDKFKVIVGTGVRDEIDQEESLLVWEIYQNYLPMKVEIIPAKKPAIGEVYSYAKEHPDQTIYWVIGGREGREDDLADIATRTKAIDKAEDKYNNVEVKIITTPDSQMSGTNARKALLANDKEAFYKFLPARVKEKEEIFTILRPASLNEDLSFEKKRELIKKIVKLAQSSGEHMSADRLADMIARKITINTEKPKVGSVGVSYGKPFVENLNEHSMGDSIDLLPYLAKLTQHMIDKGYNIEPLPGLELIDDDVANAEEFLGKTAYYDPNEQLIVLYTHGRHPKDIARSYAHEMIHHIQNLEDRLGDITTTNTQEDDHLNDIEAEANLKGTMTFRNWTDGLDEGFNKKLGKDPFGLEQFARELMTEGAYDALTTKLARATIKKWVADFKADPKRKQSFIDLDIEDVDGKGREIEFNYVGQLKFDKKSDGYEVDGTSNSGEEEDKIPFIATLFTVNPNVLPNAWSQIYMDVTDVIRHELEHLTQSGENVRSGKYMDDDIMIRDMINKLKLLPKSDYYKLDKEVDAMLQGLYLKAKKTRKPFADVINNYLDIAPGIETKEDKEAILNLWRSRRGALSLPVFENEEKVMDYKIFLDMDGVLVDFDQQFKELTGMMPREFESKYDSNKFWEEIDNAGVGFWRGMKWMPGGEALYNRAAQFDHALLSSPSRSEVSKIGKRLWRRDKTPNTKLILSRSYLKKNYAAPNHILIDDREDNIKQWRDAGGIGILYTSADQVNKELDKLGL